MSNGGDLRVWVSDLDDYVHLDAVNRDYAKKQEEEALEKELDELGDIQLLAGKCISSMHLYKRGITPEKWRWAIHEAAAVLHDRSQWNTMEPLILKDLLSLGRRYAISRYAKWESVPFTSALTATFPYGIRALLDQHLSGLDLSKEVIRRRPIHAAFKEANKRRDLPAYYRASLVRDAIHSAATDSLGSKAFLQLDKNKTRFILSLTRLHFSVTEANVQTSTELKSLGDLYEASRRDARREPEIHPLPGRKHIPRWQLRHLHPLVYFYPFSIRGALARLTGHAQVASETPTSLIALNELALARCGIMLMRQEAINNAKHR